MSLEQAGYGGLGGLIIAGISLFGIWKKLDKMDEKKQDVTVCESKHKLVEKISSDLDYIKERVDRIVNGCTEKKE